MPIIECKHCSQCRGLTLHEYVPRAVTDCCHWRCRNCGASILFETAPDGHEPRKAPRTIIPLRHLHFCTYKCVDGIVRQARLMDISPLGARIRLQPEELNGHLALHKPVALSPDLTTSGALAGFIPGTVRWNKAKDYGIQFSRRLPVQVHDLEELVGG